MSIGFFFTCQSKTIELPQNPAEITISRQGNTHQTEVLPLGEIAVLRGAKLARITVTCPLPGSDRYSFVTGDWREPSYYVKFFRQAMENKRTVRLAVSDLGVSMRLSVESLEELHTATDPDGITLRLTLQQHRSYAATVLPAEAGAPSFLNQNLSREIDKPQSPSYTVKSGDSFWAIAQRELGSGTRWNEIAQLNGKTAASIIHPGDVLQLPAR